MRKEKKTENSMKMRNIDDKDIEKKEDPEDNLEDKKENGRKEDHEEETKSTESTEEPMERKEKVVPNRGNTNRKVVPNSRFLSEPNSRQNLPKPKLAQFAKVSLKPANHGKQKLIENYFSKSEMN